MFERTRSWRYALYEVLLILACSVDRWALLLFLLLAAAKHPAADEHGREGGDGEL